MKSKIRELMVLSLYGELGEAEEFLLREHLSGDPQARAEMEELQRLHDLMAEEAWAEPSDELLYQARSQLFRRLERQEAEAPRAAAVQTPSARQDAGAGVLARLGQWLLGPEAALGWRPAAAGMAMLLLGLGAGYVLFQSGGQAPFEDFPDESNIANVRFVDTGSDQLEVVFQEVRPRRVRGSIEDADIRRLLAYAAVNDDNDGVRLRALDEFSGFPVDQTDELVKRTLIIAMQTDSNAGVRQRALGALQELPFDTAIKEAYLNVLRYDPNPGMRVAVINALEGARSAEPFQVDEDILRSLRDGAADQNDYVRLRSQEFLQKVSGQ